MHIIDLNNKNFYKVNKKLAHKPKELTAKEKAKLPKGQIPFGFKINKKGLLIKDQKEQVVIKKIIKLHKFNHSLRQICNYLNHTGIKSKKSKTWHANSVRKILKGRNS